MSEVFVFPKTAKVATIGLETLKQSSMIRSAGSNNPGISRPLQSWELIERVREMIELNKRPYDQKDIWVELRASNRILTQQEMANGLNETNTPIDKWMFDHVLTKIDIVPKKVVEGLSPAVAISFNQRGIQITWGMNVFVCQNLCIYGENQISTYGPQKMPFIKQLNVLSDWINNIDHKFKADQEIMKRMQDVPVNEDWIRETVGDLYIKAINRAYKKGLPAPVNTSTLSTLVQKMNTEDISSVWDFYNAGTAIIKPENVVLDDVLDTTIAWGMYLAEKVA